MHDDTDTPALQTVRLLRGQAYHAALKQGVLICVTAGAASVTRHVWVANTLLTVPTPLTPGSSFCLPASGWCEIATQSDAELVLVLPQSGWHQLWHRLNRLLSPLSRYQNRSYSRRLHKG